MGAKVEKGDEGDRSWNDEEREGDEGTAFIIFFLRLHIYP